MNIAIKTKVIGVTIFALFFSVLSGSYIFYQMRSISFYEQDPAVGAIILRNDMSFDAAQDVLPSHADEDLSATKENVSTNVVLADSHEKQFLIGVIEYNHKKIQGNFFHDDTKYYAATVLSVVWLMGVIAIISITFFCINLWYCLHDD